jgi:hypothetical protein
MELELLTQLMQDPKHAMGILVTYLFLKSKVQNVKAEDQAEEHRSAADTHRSDAENFLDVVDVLVKAIERAPENETIKKIVTEISRDNVDVRTILMDRIDRRKHEDEKSRRIERNSALEGPA